MQYFTPPGTDLRLSRIVFGGWAAGGWHWGGADDRATLEAVDAALENGINAFDTAPVYGFGRSEEVLGTALARHRREDFFVMTKCGLRWDAADGEKFFEVEEGPGQRPLQVFRNLRRSSIVSECEASLRRLGIERIDLYQIHWPDPSIPLDEAVQAFEELHAAGKIRWVGVSNFSVELLMEWRRKSKLPLLTDQERFNLLERKIEKSNLQFTRKNKISILAYEPLAQGLLTGRIPADRTFAPGDYRTKKTGFSTARRVSVMTALEKIRPIAEGKGITVGQLSLAWVIGVPGLAAALAGIRTKEQAKENAGAGSVALTEEESRVIADALILVPRP